MGKLDRKGVQRSTDATVHMLASADMGGIKQGWGGGKGRGGEPFQLRSV